MTDAKRDENYVTVALGQASDDSDTLPFLMDPVTGYLLVDVEIPAPIATVLDWDKRDDNHKPTMYGVSSIDLTTLVPIRTDDNGKLLVTLTNA